MTNSDTYHQLIFILLQSVPQKSHQLVFNEKCLLHISAPKDVLTVRINKLSSEWICTKNSRVLTPLLLLSFFFFLPHLQVIHRNTKNFAFSCLIWIWIKLSVCLLTPRVPDTLGMKKITNRNTPTCQLMAGSGRKFRRLVGYPKKDALPSIATYIYRHDRQKMARRMSISSAWCPLERASVPRENHVSHKHNM